MAARLLLRIVSEAGERAGLEGVNFNAIRFAKVSEEVEGPTPLRRATADLGFAGRSALLRAAGHYEKE